MSEYLVGCHFEVLHTRDIENINVEEGLAGLFCGGEGRCLQLIIDDNIDAAKKQADENIRKRISEITKGKSFRSFRIRLYAVLADETDSEKIENAYGHTIWLDFIPAGLPEQPWRCDPAGPAF